MKKLIITSIYLLAGMVSMAQGIKFEENLTWTQLKEKARKENKYIFLDAMATWCVPCKEMEVKVYPDSALGAFANDKFLSVKVQMDKTSKDSPAKKEWYADVKMLEDSYQVNSYPTYLFFSPEGKIVHRSEGLMKTVKFAELMRNALDEETQYYGRYYDLLTAYQKGKKSYKDMPYLVKMSKGFKKHELAEKIALDYIHDYLLNLSESELYVPENLEFISAYVSSKDKKVFRLFYPDGSKADAVIKGISKVVLSEVILNEEIKAKIINNGDYRQPKVNYPEWNKYSAMIQRKYGVDGGIEINSAKRKWYEQSKADNNELAKAVLELYTKYRPISKMKSWKDPFSANNAIYSTIAIGCTDKKVLAHAAKIQYEVIEKFKETRKKYKPNEVTNVAGQLDTYACLLYKSGDLKGGLAAMEKAVQEAPDWKALQDHLEQMRKGGELVLE